MKTQNTNRWNGSRGAGDFPIVIAVVIAAVFVMISVALFVVVLPNRKTAVVLKDRQAQLKGLISSQEQVLQDLQKSQEDMEQVKASSEQFRQSLVQGPDVLKTTLPTALVKNGFKAQEVEIGSSQAGPDEWWMAYPVKFSVSGPKAKFEKAIKAWRVDFPKSVRLEEVDLKKIDAKNNIQAWFKLNAFFLIPEEELTERFKVETQESSQSVPMPAPGHLEGKSLANMRRSIVEMEGQLVRQEQMMGTLGILNKKKARLLAIQEQGAQFSASRDKEFDSFETQLKSVIGKLNNKDTVQIIVKVQEAEVQNAQESIPEPAEQGS